MKYVLLTTLLAFSLLGNTSAFAKNLNKTIVFDDVTFYYYQQMNNEFLNLLGIFPETADPFKVPADVIIRTICIPVQLPGGAVNPCGLTETQTTRECPSTVPIVDTSTGETREVSVMCVGPDAEGNCDCDFGSGG